MQYVNLMCEIWALASDWRGKILQLRCPAPLTQASCDVAQATLAVRDSTVCAKAERYRHLPEARWFRDKVSSKNNQDSHILIA